LAHIRNYIAIENFKKTCMYVKLSRYYQGKTLTKKTTKRRLSLYFSQVFYVVEQVTSKIR